MRFGVFLMWLTVLSLVILVGTYLLCSQKVLYSSYLTFYISSVAIFFVWEVFNFLTSYKIFKSKTPAFIGHIYINFLLKMLLVIAIPLVYYVRYKPQHPEFIMPYIIIYLLVTVFETWFLNKNAALQK